MPNSLFKVSLNDSHVLLQLLGHFKKNDYYPLEKSWIHFNIQLWFLPDLLNQEIT